LPLLKFQPSYLSRWTTFSANSPAIAD